MASFRFCEMESCGVGRLLVAPSVRFTCLLVDVVLCSPIWCPLRRAFRCLRCMADRSASSQSSGVGRAEGSSERASPLRLLVTAGPTQEPIDAVRFIGNRSSGRVGVELASAGASRGWSVTLLLGPVSLGSASLGSASDQTSRPAGLDSRVRVERFRTTADLEVLLGVEFGGCDVLVMAAAVADYRPIQSGLGTADKLRRTGDRLVLDLEPTPDLLAGCGKRRRADQTLVGFALEPRDRLLESAMEKCERKGVDVVVANPLETMESDRIEAWLVGPRGGLGADGEGGAGGVLAQTGGSMGKNEFAGWLLDKVSELHAVRSGRVIGGVDGSVTGSGGPSHG